jgi:protein MAK16
LRARVPPQLSQNYERALEQVSTQLEFFPKFLVHRNKQRLTRIYQYLIRMRKLKLKTCKPKLVGVNKKVELRESRREDKALRAAKLNQSIQQELLERLQKARERGMLTLPSADRTELRAAVLRFTGNLRRHLQLSSAAV